MAPTAYLPVGLPGSGKSHWAHGKIAAHTKAGGPPEGLIRVCRDDIRNMMSVGYRYNRAHQVFEDIVTAARDALIVAAITAGSDVIVDEMNLSLGWRSLVVSVVESHGGRCELVDFTAVPLETCVARDRRRSGVLRVGARVIRQLHARYVAVSDGVATPAR